MRLQTVTSEHTDWIFNRLLDTFTNIRSSWSAGPDGASYVIDFLQRDVFDSLVDSATVTMTPGGSPSLGVFYGDVTSIQMGLSETITFTSDDRLCSYGTLQDWMDGLLPTRALIEMFFRGDDEIILGSTLSNQSGSTGKGYAGHDQITGGRWEDTLSGGSGNDTLVGAGRADSLLGGTGDDSLQGDSGNDVLLGGEGGDNLSGGTGRDRLIGGLGKDIASGGGADGVSDVFVFQRVADSAAGSATRDLITDFVRDNDIIDLAQIDARAGLAGNQSFSFTGQTATAHSVWYAKTASGCVLRADVTGDRQADFEIALTNVFALSAGDLVL